MHPDKESRFAALIEKQENRALVAVFKSVTHLQQDFGHDSEFLLDDWERLREEFIETLTIFSKTQACAADAELKSLTDNMQLALQKQKYPSDAMVSDCYTLSVRIWNLIYDKKIPITDPLPE